MPNYCCNGTRHTANIKHQSDTHGDKNPTHALASMIQLPKLTIGWPSQPNRSLISFRIRNVPL
jgi:hypothetical protein